METKWWIAIGVGVAAALAGAVYYEEKKSKALAAPKCPAGQSLVNGKCVKIVGVVQKGHPGAPIKQPTQSGSSFVLDPTNLNPTNYAAYHGVFPVTSPRAPSGSVSGPFSQITGVDFTGGASAIFTPTFPTGEVDVKLDGTDGTAVFHWQQQSLGQPATAYTTVLGFAAA